MVVIEIERCGDFDGIYTDSVWINLAISTVVIPELPTKEKAVKWLKENGFKPVKTKSIMVND